MIADVVSYIDNTNTDIIYIAVIKCKEYRMKVNVKKMKVTYNNHYTNK